MKLNNHIKSKEYSVQDVADWLGVPYDQILRYLRKGYIKGKRIGRAWSIPRKEVIHILAEKNEAVMKSLKIPNTLLLETFNYGGIIIKTTREVIEKCGNRCIRKPTRYYVAIKRNCCPRCQTPFRNDKCPKCGWPGLKPLEQWIPGIEYPEEHLERMRRNRRKEYIAGMAHVAVEKALREGSLLKPYQCNSPYRNFCESNGKLNAHHWSYEPEHWLDVIWCCNKCHRHIHSWKAPRFPLWKIIDIEINDVSEVY